MITAPVQTLGVLGGMGPAATAEFLRQLTILSPARTDQEHARIFLFSDPAIPDRTAAFQGSGQDPTPMLKAGLETLASWGADFLAVPCNTAHIFIDRFRDRIPVPLVHIVEVTVGRARSKNPEGAWLLATGATRDSGIYEKWGRSLGYPLHGVDDNIQNMASEVIRLVKAGRTPEAGILLRHALEILWRARDLPVILACTELPLAYDAAGLSPANAISSLDALARACLFRLYGASAVEADATKGDGHS